MRNGGTSQMAAGLMRRTAGEGIDVESAGTRPGTSVNALSAQALSEVGVDISGRTPQLLTEEMVRGADLVVTLGREASVEAVGGTPVENWDTDEPSTRGIEGIERMRLVRDDIAERVEALSGRLLGDRRS